MTNLLDFLTNLEMADWLVLIFKGVLFYFFILWAAIVIWVARDVVARTKNIGFHVLAILLVVLLNFFGLLIYLIVRPQTTLLEKYYEDLEQKTLGEGEELCGSCDRPLPLDFRYCPSCGEEARKPCKKCKRLVSKGWSKCAYCGARQKQKDSQN